MSALLLLACASPEPAVTIDVRRDGLDVHATAPIARVEVDDGRGPATIVRLPSAAEDAWIAMPPAPAGELRVRIAFEDGRTATRRVSTLPSRCDVAVATAGSTDSRRVPPNSVVPITRIADGPIQATITVTAGDDGPYAIRCGEHRERFDLRGGERRALAVDVVDPVACEVSCGEQRVPFSLEATTVRTDGPPVRIVAIAFPAGPDGSGDPAGSPDRVAVPAAWWESARQRFDLGTRPPDSQAPWAFAGVVVANDAALPLDLAIRLRVTDENGAAAGAFRPRIRDEDGGIDAVVAMARIPAHGEATVALPVYVDRVGAAAGSYAIETRLEALGTAAPLAVDRHAIYVTRGSTPASVGLLAALAAAAGGLALMVGWGRAFLAGARTSDLTTIALFATIQLVVGVASQLFASAATTAIGPLAPLVTGLVDESIRAAILATLVTLVPRPGAVGASIVIGYLLRLLALGTFTPIDFVWLGDAVLFHEVLLYATGVTRGTAWRDRSAFHRWARLAGALAPATMLTAACALAVHVAAFRMFYAEWYVGMVLIGPSFLYVAFACGLAVPFADSLRRVAP